MGVLKRRPPVGLEGGGAGIEPAGEAAVQSSGSGRLPMSALQDVVDRTRARTLAARALSVARRGPGVAAGAVVPAVALTAAQVADRAADSAAHRITVGRGRRVNSADVFRWWVAAAQVRYGAGYVVGSWTRAQQAKAKQLLAAYGAALVEQVVGALWAAAPDTQPPTLDVLHAARERAFAAWQLEGKLPTLSTSVEARGRRAGRADRDRKKNFDEYDGGEWQS